MYPEQQPQLQQSEPNQLQNNMEEFNPNIPKPVTTFTQPAKPNTSKTGIPKKMIIIGAIVAISVVSMIVIVVVSISKKSDTSTQPETPVTSQSLVPEPATSSGLQQTNTSISQDLNGLDNAKDFPATRLDDKTLGL
jgi:hypothetical protein